MQRQQEAFEATIALRNQIFNESALEMLQAMPDDCIDCIVTSPPYWALRDYGVAGQLGNEPTFQQYIENIVIIMSECRRVLKPTGTLWLNLGDTFAGSKIGNTNNNMKEGIDKMHLVKPKSKGIRDKSLIGIPDRIKTAMIDDGWICRNEIIWWKRNAMPSSAMDRFTIDFEKIFLFVKSPKRYFFEQQYERLKTKPHGQVFGGNKAKGYGRRTYSGKAWHPRTAGGGSTLEKRREQGITGNTMIGLPVGRLKRCVWDITTKPFKGAHFAVFPEQLVEIPIKAGCPQQICKACGEARRIIYREARKNTRPGRDVGNAKSGTSADPNAELHKSDLSKYRQEIIREPIKLTDCGCNAGWQPGIVLDPFFGSGTTGLVALKNGRDFIGIELNKQYIEIAQKRLDKYLKQERLS